MSRNRPIVPIRERPSRMVEMGKLKVGVFRGRPQGIETWRIMSSHRGALETLAREYGGEITPVVNQKAAHRLELVTESPTLNVVLPPDPLGDSPMYEKWGGKGQERLCDGVTCTEFRVGREGVDEIVKPCICRINGKECKPKLRLAVLITSVPMGGVWTFTSDSEQNAATIPGMVHMIQEYAQRGMPYATLTVKPASSWGGTQKYVLVDLAPVASLNELAAGGGTLTAGSLHAAPQAPEMGVLAAVPDLGRGAVGRPGAGPGPTGSRGPDGVVGPLGVNQQPQRGDFDAEEIAEMDRHAAEADARELVPRLDDEPSSDLREVMARIIGSEAEATVKAAWKDAGLAPLSRITASREDHALQIVVSAVETVAGIVCPDCGQQGIIRDNGCLLCGGEPAY